MSHFETSDRRSRGRVYEEAFAMAKIFSVQLFCVLFRICQSVFVCISKSEKFPSYLSIRAAAMLRQAVTATGAISSTQSTAPIGQLSKQFSTSSQYDGSRSGQELSPTRKWFAALTSKSEVVPPSIGFFSYSQSSRNMTAREETVGAICVRYLLTYRAQTRKSHFRRQ